MKYISIILLAYITFCGTATVIIPPRQKLKDIYKDPRETQPSYDKDNFFLIVWNEIADWFKNKWD